MIIGPLLVIAGLALAGWGLRDWIHDTDTEDSE